MTAPDLMALLRSRVDELGQAQVARELGYSAATVSQVVNDKYQGDPANILARVKEVYGGLSIDCPVVGEIPLSRCADYRKRPFAATNPLRVALYRACRSCTRGA